MAGPQQCRPREGCLLAVPQHTHMQDPRSLIDPTRYGHEFFEGMPLFSPLLATHTHAPYTRLDLRVQAADQAPATEFCASPSHSSSHPRNMATSNAFWAWVAARLALTLHVLGYFRAARRAVRLASSSSCCTLGACCCVASFFVGAEPIWAETSTPISSRTCTAKMQRICHHPSATLLHAAQPIG